MANPKTQKQLKQVNYNVEKSYWYTTDVGIYAHLYGNHISPKNNKYQVEICLVENDQIIYHCSLPMNNASQSPIIQAIIYDENEIKNKNAQRLFIIWEYQLDDIPLESVKTFLYFWKHGHFHPQISTPILESLLYYFENNIPIFGFMCPQIKVFNGYSWEEGAWMLKLKNILYKRYDHRNTKIPVILSLLIIALMGFIMTYH